MIPIQLFANFSSAQMDHGFSSGRETCRRRLCITELSLFCMDNFESIESPGLGQPLHIHYAFQILTLH